MNILNASNMLMSQPLPHSLLPLETNRIIRNERMLPGITKILQIGQDFPILNLSPQELSTWPNPKLAALNQSCMVYVFEDWDDLENRDRNGTLKLLEKLAEE